MANKLFPGWTWSIPRPDGFIGIHERSTEPECISRYNDMRNRRSTLHGPALKGILAYIFADHDPEMWGGIGRRNEHYFAEYSSSSGNLHMLHYNAITHRIEGIVENDNGGQSSYCLPPKEVSGCTVGSAIFYLLMPLALEDDEFRDHFAILSKEIDPTSINMSQKAVASAFVLCDNLYRRTMDNFSEPSGLKVDMPADGNLDLFAVDQVTESFQPTELLCGELRKIPVAIKRKVSLNLRLEDRIGHFNLPGVELSDEEKALIPEINPEYTWDDDLEFMCQLIEASTATPTPFRNVFMEGEAGVGKSVACQMIAQAFGLPYRFLNCDPHADKSTFDVKFTPKVGISEESARPLPSVRDIRMDPEGAYKKMTGEAHPGISYNEVYEQLIGRLEERLSCSVDEEFKLIESEFVNACRRPCVLELAEFKAIKNGGVAVSLNSIMEDRLRKMVLESGEVLERHPHTIVIATANPGSYVGVNKMDQSVISRFHLWHQFPQPTTDVLLKNTLVNTACKDKQVIRKMIKAILAIQKKCKDEFISDGIAGQRELTCWANSYAISNDVLESAQKTLVCKVTSDETLREEIYDTCILPFFNAAA